MTEHSRKPTILAFVRYYLPGYKAGGPIRTISNMVEALGEDFDFRIVTSDRDASDISPYPAIAVGRWEQVGKAQVRYLSPDMTGLRQIARLLRETPHDVLYLNSFFDPVFTQKPLMARRLGIAPKARCILAPRGEFSKGALELKAIKKRTFLLAARASGLYAGLDWHASSPYEEMDIRRSLSQSEMHIQSAIHIKVAIDLTATKSFKSSFVPRNAGEPLRVCFLSRISPMKNLDFAIRALAQVRNRVEFDIYGPIGDIAYWQQCKALLSALPSHVSVTFHGDLEHERVAVTLSEHDLFFLPTRGENYGHVIFESLSAGTPVLISDQTPWKGLEEIGAGWALPLYQETRFANIIDEVAELYEEQYLDIRCRSLEYSRSCMNDDAIKENRLLFQSE